MRARIERRRVAVKEISSSLELNSSMVVKELLL